MIAALSTKMRRLFSGAEWATGAQCVPWVPFEPSAFGGAGSLGSLIGGEPDRDPRLAGSANAVAGAS